MISGCVPLLGVRGVGQHTPPLASGCVSIAAPMSASRVSGLRATCVCRQLRKSRPWLRTRANSCSVTAGCPSCPNDVSSTSVCLPRRPPPARPKFQASRCRAVCREHHGVCCVASALVTQAWLPRVGRSRAGLVGTPRGRYRVWCRESVSR